MLKYRIYNVVFALCALTYASEQTFGMESLSSQVLSGHYGYTASVSPGEDNNDWDISIKSTAQKSYPRGQKPDPADTQEEAKISIPKLYNSKPLGTPVSIALAGDNSSVAIGYKAANGKDGTTLELPTECTTNSGEPDNINFKSFDNSRISKEFDYVPTYMEYIDGTLFAGNLHVGGSHGKNKIRAIIAKDKIFFFKRHSSDASYGSWSFDQENNFVSSKKENDGSINITYENSGTEKTCSFSEYKETNMYKKPSNQANSGTGFLKNLLVSRWKYCLIGLPVAIGLIGIYVCNKKKKADRKAEDRKLGTELDEQEAPTLVS